MAELSQEQQFSRAYEQYADAIFRYCYYRVYDREKAKDVMQEAFCRTWKYLSAGKTIENLRAFLYKTANHIIIDESRKKKNTSLDTMMEKGFTPKTDPRQKTQDYFTGQELIAIVQQLDEKYREVILLKYVNDFSPREIAQLIGETENNVYVRLSRGLDKVKEIIEHQEA